jgi:hypothetical protein
MKNQEPTGINIFNLLRKTQIIWMCCDILTFNKESFHAKNILNCLFMNQSPPSAFKKAI